MEGNGLIKKMESLILQILALEFSVLKSKDNLLSLA